MFSKYYEKEEDNGFIRSHYFKKIEIEKIDKNLINLEKTFYNDDIFLDIYINEKEKNNFDFFLNSIEGMNNRNYLEKWINIDISNIYNYILYDNKYCSDIVNDKKGYLILKLKYTNENKIITSYFKVNCRNVKWENEKKVWHIPLFYIFEISKLTLFLGGTVSDLVLYYLCKLFNHFSSIKNVNNLKINELNKEEIKSNEVNNKETRKDNIKINNNNNNNYNEINNEKERNDSIKHNENKIEENKLNNDIINNNQLNNNVSNITNMKTNNSLSNNNHMGKIYKTENDQNNSNVNNKSYNSINENSYSFDIFIKENKMKFIEYLKNVKMFKIEHVIVNNILKSDSMYIKILPYNEEIIKKIKETNLFQWNKIDNIWVIKKTNFKNFYINIIKFFDFKICSYYDYFKISKQKLLENEIKSNQNSIMINNIILKTENIKKKRKKIINEIKENEKKFKQTINYESTDSSYSDELSKNVDSSYYEGRELVNKIKLIGAANNYYKDIIYNKLNKVKHLRPPNYSYDPKGLITKNGAGTKGIEIYDLPSDVNEWNKISFCIVPNEKAHVDLYDPKILCSLVSDVYLLKERAIDIILKKYKRWPEYSDAFWNTICSENEFIVCNKNFNTRQKLAHDRLFNKQFFYIFNIESVKQSNYYDPLFLCKTLIILGEGKLVKDPLESEYIIISNSTDQNSISFYNSLQEKNKKKKLPLFVTPYFIYDCILNYSISYPSKNKNHFSFA
ncbi:conserved Plasmodium protein, unknown function [Plasmodium relictum]|uniref:BRCT domain-containing protein n=1 Tax=Plasmodium relictum TaxID=85471 RepID=A0A1J1HGX7_PLARL|nr:conserved Plasmodium protein, unknown function [Plasmodium relictum]CRH03085.1 conserved Plasmodium protein, unknown function [Plasmodium relictum]